MSAKELSLGMLEMTSIARGVVVADSMVKRAPVKLLEAKTVCPGKFVVLICGEVDEVREAMATGKHYAGTTLIDELFLPKAHEDLPEAIVGATQIGQIEAVGIIETFSVSSTIIAADAAAKAAPIKLMELRLASGLGGKSFFTFTGTISDVEASIADGCSVIESGLICNKETIPAPHPDLSAKLR